MLINLNIFSWDLSQFGTFLLLIFILLISFFPFYLLRVKNNKEGFLTPGNYPSSSETPLLAPDSYSLVNKPGVTTYGSNDAYRDYPVYPADFDGTNNIKYWTNPDNGTCSFLETCGGLYKNNKQMQDEELPEPSWNNRVNYYQHQDQPGS
jgi:hypothetical protein